MDELRKAIRWCFALQALVALTLIPSAVVRLARWHHDGAALADQIAPGLTLIVLIVTSTAWWVSREGKSSARKWALGASFVTVLYSVCLLWSDPFDWHDPGYVTLGIGGAGLIAFWRSDVQNFARRTAPKTRIKGDRTHPLVGALVSVAFVFSYVFAFVWWAKWAEVRELALAEGLRWFALWSGALLLALAAHEIGHYVVGKIFAMKLYGFRIGPIQWRIRNGRWKFEFRLRDTLSFGGAVFLIPTKQDQPRSDSIWMLSGGPIMGLCIGSLALFAALHAVGRRWESARELLAYTGTFCMITSILNLVPFWTGRLYSDGARILQLLTRSPVVDVQRAFLGVLASMVTPMRPRDYDLQGLQRASSLVPDGVQGILLRLLMSSHFHDCGRLQEAREEFASAETVHDAGAVSLTPSIHTVFVFYHAILNRDPAASRMWWERMEAKKGSKPQLKNFDYWNSRAALLWVEGDLTGANEAWRNGYDLTKDFPAAGAYERDRDLSVLLRELLDQTATVSRVSVDNSL